MATPHLNIQKLWQNGFLKSAIVDQEKKCLIKDVSHQLLYGKTSDSYNAEWPNGFEHFANHGKEIEEEKFVQILFVFLNFIGTPIATQSLLNYIRSGKGNRKRGVLIRKTLQIFKTLAHQNSDKDALFVFMECDNDWFYLLELSSKNGNQGEQLEIPDMDLPKLYNLPISLPDNYESDPFINQLFNSIENSKDNFFITGKAGTGKSTFIHYLCAKSKKKIIKSAFTGIASVNIGGETLHSLFQFPLKPLLVDDEEILTFNENSFKKKVLEEFDMLIIDEVSMLRSDILQAVDCSLRRNTGNFNLPFGGKQIILVGDVFQLPPVVNDRDEIERVVFKEEYKSPYFFDAPIFQTTNFNKINLTKVHRQGSDREFVELLDDVRMSKINDERLEKLNGRFNPLINIDEAEFTIYLTTTNGIAKNINLDELAKLKTELYDSFAKIEGVFPEDRFPTDPILKIKKGAQVIFIKNDKAKRWINGTIGKVEFVADDIIEVRLQDGNIYRVQRESWENRQYYYNRTERRITSKVIGYFHHFPLKLAWAITIHKCQGLTLDKVIIDLGWGAFSNGQVYTALSRCRTFNGITLKKKIRHEDLILDQRIIDFQNGLNS